MEGLHWCQIFNSLPCQDFHSSTLSAPANAVTRASLFGHRILQWPILQDFPFLLKYLLLSFPTYEMDIFQQKHKWAGFNVLQWKQKAQQASVPL